MNTEKFNAFRRFFGSTLFGFGIMNFFCFIILELWWATYNPKAPDLAHGFVIMQRVKGFTSYFSQFQITAIGLLFYVSIPLVAVGYLIAPRKWDIAPNGQLAKYPKLMIDDPTGIHRWGTPIGFIMSPLALYFVGQPFVRWLNGLGF